MHFFLKFSFFVLFMSFFLNCGSESELELCNEAMELYCSKGFECNLEVLVETFKSKESCKESLKNSCEKTYGEETENSEELDKEKTKQCIKEMKELSCKDFNDINWPEACSDIEIVEESSGGTS